VVLDLGSAFRFRFGKNAIAGPVADMEGGGSEEACDFTLFPNAVALGCF
jgi:hypothetical protein